MACRLGRVRRIKGERDEERYSCVCTEHYTHALYKWVHWELVHHTKATFNNLKKNPMLYRAWDEAAYTVLTDGANLLFDLIRHGLMKVLELYTQSKVS